MTEKTGHSPANITPHTSQNMRGVWPCGCKVYGPMLEMDWCPLHATATDLLAACERLLKAQDEKDVDGRTSAAILASAAIAKAGGRSE